MNINEAVEKIISLQKTCISYRLRPERCKLKIADILQELLDTGGVGKEYMEVEK